MFIGPAPTHPAKLRRSGMSLSRIGRLPPLLLPPVLPSTSPPLRPSRAPLPPPLRRQIHGRCLPFSGGGVIKPRLYPLMRFSRSTGGKKTRLRDRISPRAVQSGSGVSPRAVPGVPRVSQRRKFVAEQLEFIQPSLYEHQILSKNRTHPENQPPPSCREVGCRPSDLCAGGQQPNRWREPVSHGRLCDSRVSRDLRVECVVQQAQTQSLAK
jgi:hypothetical protein